MSDKPETLAAILAKYRKDIACGQFFTPTQEYILRLLDRIEAAVKREREEDRQLAAIAESDEAFARCARCDRPERATDNAAAMRAALENLVHRKCLVSGSCSKPIAEQCEHPSCVWYECRAALAEPARNCDKFATADDARDAAKKEFANTMLLDDRQLRAVCDWLFAPAEGGDHA